MNSTREEVLFALVREKPLEQRSAFLDVMCEGDPALRQRLETLLAAAHEQTQTLQATQTGAAARRMIKPVVSDTSEEAVGQMVGRYKLLEKIGEGGCGVVYVAEQTEPVRRRVALKVIKLGMDTRQVVARFEAERQALAMMDHPNIAKVLDAGTTGARATQASSPASLPSVPPGVASDGGTPPKPAGEDACATLSAGRPYFVMELVRGVKITDYCDQNNRTTRDRLELVVKVCQAIQHAHQKGIIHRDIKPSNILVTLHDGVAVPKVIDFGIAKATEGRLTDATVYTQLHQFIGTPAYMSPEQAEMSGLDIDTRSDIYSLGVLLYEMLTGKTPFDATELMAQGFDAMRQTIREKEPSRPSTKLATLQGEELTTTAQRRSAESAKLVHQLQGDLDWIVMKCLEKDRTRRYDTVNGLAMDLKRHLNHEPVLARPPSAAYKFQKAFRRNRVVFSAAAAVVLALVVGIGASLWQTFAARKAQRETELARRGEQQQRLQAQSEQKRADTQAQNALESQQHSRRLLYASDMNLAQQALIQNNIGKARRLLDRHRPQPSEEDLRGWEWRYLWQQTRSSALVTLTNRPARGFSVSFSPDGTRLAVGWYDGRVDLWDVPGRRWIRALTDRENLPPGRVAFSPVANLLAATSEAKSVTLYDLDTGRESVLWRAPEQGAWDVRDLAFSGDGSRVSIYAGLHPAKGRMGDEVWVANVASGRIEHRHATFYSEDNHFGAAQISPDNRRLYLARSDYRGYRYHIQCLDLRTGEELWQTESERDQGLTTLALSPDGRVLVSGSGYEDPTIRVWDAVTGRLLVRLSGHTGWVCKLLFTRDGRHLISVASDQSLRFWDTSLWTETRVLRGHTDEVHAVAVSETAHLVASGSKDGELMLWREEGTSATEGYRRLPEYLGDTLDLWNNQVRSLNHSRLLLLPSGKPPELLDLQHDLAPVPVPDIGSSANVLGVFGTNVLCHWNGTNQILVREWRGNEFVHRAAITLDSGARPTGFAYNPRRQLLAWTEAGSSTSVYLVSLMSPGRRVELKTEAGPVNHLYFSVDGGHLAGLPAAQSFLRAWNVDSGQIVASIDETVGNSTFVADGRVLVAAVPRRNGHEIQFYDLAHTSRPPRRVPGRHFSSGIAVSPSDGLMASATGGGEVRLFDPGKGELIESIHGHLNAIFGLDFSPDGRRLISASGGREAVKLWDVGTRQELLTLSGTGSTLGEVRWTADGDAIIAGPPWQAWRAPSWEEIIAAEAKEKTERKQP